MSQNVDENEEYELTNIELKQQQEQQQQKNNLDILSPSPSAKLINNRYFSDKIDDAAQDEAVSLLNETTRQVARKQEKSNSLKPSAADEARLKVLRKDNNNKDTLLLNSGDNERHQMWSSVNFNEATSFTTQASTNLDSNSNNINNSNKLNKFHKPSSKEQSQQQQQQRRFLNPKQAKPEVVCQPHELFIELKLLQQNKDLNCSEVNLPDEQQYEWRQVSRWIKYEQNLDMETNIWSNPYVGALVYQSLLYLKTGLQYGTVLLNSDHDSFADVVDEVIQDFIDSGHMNKENKTLVRRALLSSHRHDPTNSGGFIRKKSTISDFFPGSRRPSSFNSEQVYHSENNSSSASRKNSYAQFSESSKRMDAKLSASEVNLEKGVSLFFFIIY